jgi:hypothetical protein
MVRRAALHLLRALVEHNPFGPHANAAAYEEQATAESRWLADHGGDEEEARTAAAGHDTALTGDGDTATADLATVAASPAAEHARARATAMLAAEFSRVIEGAVPVLQQMLTSKAGSDVMGAIRFLSRARAFDIPGASQGLAQMLTLVWSPEPGVKEEVVSDGSRRGGGGSRKSAALHPPLSCTML